MKGYLCYLVKTPLIIFISVLIGVLMLMLVYSLPTEKMFIKVNAAKSVWQNEGIGYSWAEGRGSAGIDNFTNSIMVKKVIFPGTGSVVEDALLNPSVEYKNSNQVQSLIKQLRHEEDNKHTATYSRYWHGYLLFLKPVFLFCTFGYIRMLNLFAQMLLTGYLLMKLFTNFGKGYCFAYFITYLFLNPVSLSMSFQYSTMFYLMTFFSMVVLLKWDCIRKKLNYLWLFLAAGIATAFFDCLTYPMVSLGIPFIVLLLKLNQDGMLCSFREAACQKLFASTCFWGIGYGGMYFGKWVIATLLTNENVIATAINQAKYRASYHTVAGEGGRAITPLSAISRNLQIIAHEPTIIILGILLIVLAYRLYVYRKDASLKSALGKSLLLTSLLPFLWYAVLCNHSYVHSWFTYREMAIFVFAVGCYFSNALSE